MTCHYRFLACHGDDECPHSGVELDGLDREELAINE